MNNYPLFWRILQIFLVLVKNKKFYVKLFFESVLKSKGFKLACYDNAVLIEKSDFEKYRPIVVVHVDLETQIKRVLGRNPHLSKDDVLKRIHSQMSAKKRLSYADYVIDNSGTLEDTLSISDTILLKIKNEYET